MSNAGGAALLRSGKWQLSIPVIYRLKTLDLSELGDRICIMGQSNSGKSTLADAIARKIEAQAIHLDVRHHFPGRIGFRPFTAFERSHNTAIEGERWVIDGNYSQLLSQRLARATEFILLDISTALSLLRYFRRASASVDGSEILKAAKTV